MLVGRFEVRTSDHLTISLYDRLVSNDVLDLVGPGARLLYVGKTAGYHSRTQVKIMSFFGCVCVWVCGCVCVSVCVCVCMVVCVCGCVAVCVCV